MEILWILPKASESDFRVRPASPPASSQAALDWQLDDYLTFSQGRFPDHSFDRWSSPLILESCNCQKMFSSGSLSFYPHVGVFCSLVSYRKWCMPSPLLVPLSTPCTLQPIPIWLGFWDAFPFWLFSPGSSPTWKCCSIYPICCQTSSGATSCDLLQLLLQWLVNTRDSSSPSWDWYVLSIWVLHAYLLHIFMGKRNTFCNWDEAFSNSHQDIPSVSCICTILVYSAKS